MLRHNDTWRIKIHLLLVYMLIHLKQVSQYLRDKPEHRENKGVTHEKRPRSEKKSKRPFGCLVTCNLVVLLVNPYQHRQSRIPLNLTIPVLLLSKCRLPTGHLHFPALQSISSESSRSLFLPSPSPKSF